MPRLRNIINSVATYLQNPDGSNGQICDRATFESFGVDTQEVIQMRKELLGVANLWNETDLDTETVIADPATNVPAPAVQAGDQAEAAPQTK